MKRYLEFIKEAFFSNLEDYELQEKLQELEREKKEIEEEILQINQVLKERQEESDREFVKDWPKSIFDLNKEQLDWIFEFQTGNSYRIQISKSYFNQLVGVFVLTESSRASKSGQYQVKINSEYSMNVEETEFELNPEQIRSIKFVGDNLKREFSTTPIEILIDYNFYHSTLLPGQIQYQDENNIYYGRKRFNSIEAVVRQIVESDIKTQKDDDDDE